MDILRPRQGNNAALAGIRCTASDKDLYGDADFRYGSDSTCRLWSRWVQGLIRPVHPVRAGLCTKSRLKGRIETQLRNQIYLHSVENRGGRHHVGADKVDVVAL